MLALEVKNKSARSFLADLEHFNTDALMSRVVQRQTYSYQMNSIIRICQNQVAPGTKYLPKYDELGNVKQIKMYDDYGREIGWVDYTNHGYGDINSPHYHTTPHWHEKTYNAQYPDGIKINHRTDVNTPLGDK